MKIGIIGGSGLYEIEGLNNVRYETVETPFGEPSDAYCCAELDGVSVAFLPRHGRGHRIMPSEINHRANIYGFKLLGVECLFSVSAVGSLREELRPRDVVLPDQYFDRTKQSLAHTFFGDGIVAHVSMADPTCPALRGLLAEAMQAAIDAADVDVRVHEGGTYINMEGPAFSTRAESHAYRQLGCDVIGMTSLGEAKLCREAEICYQPMAMVTDYDCWHEDEEPVTVEMVIGHLQANTALAKAAIGEVVARIESRDCACRHALQHAILTAPDAVSPEARRRLEPIITKYLQRGLRPQPKRSEIRGQRSGTSPAT